MRLVQNRADERADIEYERQRQAMQDFQLESRAACEASGCEIIEVDVPSFQKAVASVYDEYPQYKELVDAIRAVE